MNWLLSIKRLLGRFWADIFKDTDFLLGVEYLMSFYSKLTENQYLNWRNGMIAADLTVAQAGLPFVVLIDAASIVKEWYPWQRLWDNGSAELFYAHDYDSEASEDSMGWLATCKASIDIPDYMMDHVYGYNTILVKGSDYDFSDGRFLFYTDPAALDLPTVKEIDSDGNLHIYYRLFGYALQTTKVCDPVTGFESAWLNSCSDIAWDIHTNGATFYNTKRLLGKATGSIVSETEGTVTTNDLWDDQDYHCIKVGDKVYYSKLPCNIVLENDETIDVAVGDVLFGSLAVYKGTDTVTPEEVPGIKVMTDAGVLTAENNEVDTYISPGSDRTIILPLTGDSITVNAYRAKCVELYKDATVPYIQVPYPKVNPYEFIVKTLRRGRAVTIRLVADSLDYLAAAIACIRKSSCAAGMLNIYVAASTDAADASTLTTAVFSADAGMMAVAVAETLTIKREAAEARVIL